MLVSLCLLVAAGPHAALNEMQDEMLKIGEFLKLKHNILKKNSGAALQLHARRSSEVRTAVALGAVHVR